VLLIGGGMANTMLLAQGREVGRSLVEREMLETASAVLRRAAERGVRIELPTDVVVADAIASPTRVEVVAAECPPT
jgi:phosphoglycerate kinase